MGAVRRRLWETARALCVVALASLNFGHAHVAAQMPAADAPVTVAGASTCSAPVLDQRKDHAPRRIYRTAVDVDLPPPPCSIGPRRGLAIPVRYATDRHVIVLRAVWRDAVPRAPPALV